MARRPRLDMAGFHHIVNRGVAKHKVYSFGLSPDPKVLVIIK